MAYSTSIHETPATSSTARLSSFSKTRPYQQGVGRDQPGVSACHLSSLLATQLINNMTANDNLFTVTLPTQDAPEDYWVQQVIITFQQAVTVGGTEFYPFCTRMRNGLAQPNHVHS